MKYSNSFRETVQADFSKGMTVEEAVKKYGISLYFAKLWKGVVFENQDVMAYAQDRYRRLVTKGEVEVENEMMKIMSPQEMLAISDSTWEGWGKAIKKGMYELAARIEKVR